MLTNLYHASNLLSSQATLTLTVTFDSTISSLLRLNRTTGQQEIVSLTNHALTLTLPGGTGDLFKYNNGVSFVLNGTQTSLPTEVMGASNKAVLGTLMTQIAPNYMWVLWGKVSNATASAFDIDDGSGVVIHVNGANTLSNGDYVAVQGTLVVGLQPYCKNHQVFVCPSNPNWAGEQGTTTYAINQWICAGEDWAQTTMSNIPYVTKCWWFVEQKPENQSYPTDSGGTQVRRGHDVHFGRYSKAAGLVA